MLTRRNGAACETAQKSAELWQPLSPNVDRQIRQRPPEVFERGAVGGRSGTHRKALVVHIDMTVDRDVVRRCTQPGHLGIEAYLEGEGGRRAAVHPGLEQECVSLRAELVAYLLGGDGVDGRLDLTRRHAGVEDDDIRAERYSIRSLGQRRSAEYPRSDDDDSDNKPHERETTAQGPVWFLHHDDTP